jgi:hypothetical protein
MQDDEITLFNACTNLVSLKKSEPFPKRLLSTKRPGEWVAVGEFCQQIGLELAEIGAGLFATWLPDPLSHDGYAIIMFYDDESKWSMAAHFNRGRILGADLASEAIKSTGAALPVSPSSTSPPAPRAAEL